MLFFFSVKGAKACRRTRKKGTYIKKIVISIYKLESKYKVLGDFYIIIYFELMYTLASA